MVTGQGLGSLWRPVPAENEEVAKASPWVGRKPGIKLSAEPPSLSGCLPSPSLAKSLFSSSSAVSLEKLSSSKGFHVEPSEELQTFCWEVRGEPDGVVVADLDLFKLASAAAAWSSWVDLLAGTPKTALCVTSLRILLCPAR